jgi:hypothetical protein
MNGIQDEELIHLWQKAALRAPDPEEIAQWVGRMAVRRVDRFSAMVNFVTGAFGLAGFTLLGWAAYEGTHLDVSLLGFLCVGPVLAYVWWVQRGLPALDPAANSRSYQSAILARLDRQIRLARTARYWALPIFAWVLYVFLWDSAKPLWFLDVKELSVDTAQYLALSVFAYVAGVWGSEHSAWGASGLSAKRAMILVLYERMTEPEA